MLMDSISEVDLDLLSEIRHIQRSGYDDEYDEYDEYADEPVRGFGHPVEREWYDD